MTIEIIAYQPGWPADFLTIGLQLRAALGSLAMRIDHIGSTAVPMLAAKDRIDIQITVQDLTPQVEKALNTSGYTRIQRITQDHIPAQGPNQIGEWDKWVFQPPAAQRPTNVHIRIAGRANQRYALLFRDYLRAHPAGAQSYAQIKRALTRCHSEDHDFYYDVKDPVVDLIITSAEWWAAATHWQPGPSDC